MERLHSKLRRVSDSAKPAHSGSLVTSFLLMFFLAIPLLANGQSLYKDGMTWHTLVGGTHDPEGKSTSCFVTMEETETPDCFNVYKSYENLDNVKNFVCVIKTEGQKVYFKKDDSDSAEWYLMYDFGLLPGDGCYVYRPESTYRYDDQTGKYEPYKTYVECTAYLPDAEWPIMVMTEPEEGFNDPLGEGFWIKGLSSTDGLLWNNRFSVDGAWSNLTEVTCDGEIIYSNDGAGISDVRDSVNPTVTVEGRDLCITVDADTTGRLYTPSGVLVGTYSLGSTPTRIKLPSAGVYILKIGNTSRKIVVP